MELNYAPTRQVNVEAKNTAAGLSSPQQLIEVTTPLAIKVDQTAAGSPLFIFKPEESLASPQDNLFIKSDLTTPRQLMMLHVVSLKIWRISAITRPLS